ncbi:MAG: hypothetical protein PHY79_19765 [Anaerolineae bacterium]|nr:hypothetical protein [Anaerolineae bacterium]
MVEGVSDETVARRLVSYVGLGVGRVYGKAGKGYLLRRLPKYNAAAQFQPWFAVVDLDNAPECAPALIYTTLPRPASGMRFRVAVRAIESWLLADVERMAQFLGIPVRYLPPEPDLEVEPKITLVNLARRSHYRLVREDMVPRERTGRKVGPGYPSRIIEFASERWRPEVARERSPSLAKCIDALHGLRDWLNG